MRRVRAAARSYQDTLDAWIDRCARAERLALDLATLAAAAEEWRGWKKSHGKYGRYSEAIVTAVDALPDDWRARVHEMGHDTDEYPLGDSP